MLRRLPPEEWHRLGATEASEIWQTLPGHAIPLVVERHGEIVGEWTFVMVAHVECVWKRADAGSGVSRLLWKGMREIAHEHGVSGVVTSAQTDEVRALLAKRATKLEGDHFVMEMR